MDHTGKSLPMGAPEQHIAPPAQDQWVGGFGNGREQETAADVMHIVNVLQMMHTQVKIAHWMP